MKKIALLLSFAFALTLAAHENHEEGKSCDMGKGKDVSISGKVVCKGDDDCTFQTADTNYTLCEMSKADLPKLSAAGKEVTVKGKLITCDGAEKLRILKIAE